jgi:hypothetical protein
MKTLLAVAVTSRWLLTGATLHQVDVATWKTTTQGPVTGLDKSVVDIAVLP